MPPRFVAWLGAFRWDLLTEGLSGYARVEVADGLAVVTHADALDDAARRCLRRYVRAWCDSRGLVTELSAHDILGSADCVFPCCDREALPGKHHCDRHEEYEFGGAEEPLRCAKPLCVGKALPGSCFCRAHEPIEALRARRLEFGEPPTLRREETTMAWTKEDVRDTIREVAAYDLPPASTSDRWPRGLVPAAKNLFGSWANAVEEAGFPRPNRGGNRRTVSTAVVSTWKTLPLAPDPATAQNGHGRAATIQEVSEAITRLAAAQERVELLQGDVDRARDLVSVAETDLSAYEADLAAAEEAYAEIAGRLETRVRDLVA